MDTILPSNEYTEFEGRAYLNPNLTVDETSSFIDNYRNTQNQNTQQINTQTQRLGTDVPTNIGGLTGAGSYFTSRYQKPQAASVIANLKATAQAKALNDALANEQAMWKKRYQDAYNAYQKRSWNKQNPTTQNPEDEELPTDTNTENGTIEVDKNNPQPGDIIENTKYVSDYQDANTKQWYQLTNPREIDLIAAQTSLVGANNPADGATVVVPSGRTLRYVAATDKWYEQTNSAGPNTYSPRYW